MSRRSGQTGMAVAGRARAGRGEWMAGCFYMASLVVIARPSHVAVLLGQHRLFRRPERFAVQAVP